MENIQFGNKDYQSIYNLRHSYRRAGGHSDTYAGNFNRFDNPNLYFFRIFFDFHKGLLDYAHDLGRVGRPDQDAFWDRNTYIANSALNYLMINNEWERADMLREFIHLISNINTYSPWYFTEIEGLGEVLNRTEFTADAFALPEIKAVNIKCLPDAFDNRIGTLIDLYRAICYSYQLHKEVVPANLRRFDMYVYIFAANTRGVHTLHKYVEGTDNIESKEPAMDKFASYDQHLIRTDDDGRVKYDSNSYLASSKLIQLSGCEIDLNASVSGYQGVKNDEGFAQEYTIPIKVRTVMEQRYNEFLMKRIGDFVIADMDLPGANDEGAGESREMIWDYDDASNAVLVPASDNRMDVGLMRRGMVSPKQGDEDDYESYIKLNESSLLGTNKYRDQHKTSLLDPWLNMGAQKVEQLAGQVNQMINAGKSALDSWTDVSRLNESLVGGAGSLLDRLMWGNLFGPSIQSVANNVSQKLSGLSSGNVINQATRSGWTYKDRKSPGNPGQLNQNISRTSNQANGNYRPTSAPPEGNIFNQRDNQATSSERR